MSIPYLYALTGAGLFFLGLFGLISYDHLLRKILAVNVLGSLAELCRCCTTCPCHGHHRNCGSRLRNGPGPDLDAGGHRRNRSAGIAR